MNAREITKTIAEVVSAARMKAGMPKKLLAERTGIPRTTLYRKLNGDADFTFPEIFRIATALGISPEDLTPPVFRGASRSRSSQSREEVAA